MTTVSDLPEEALAYILRWLQLPDRKNAALVCRLWNRLAFSFSGCPRRMCLRINLELTRAEKYMLLQSDRIYHSLSLTFDKQAPEFRFLQAVMEKFGSRMISLTIRGLEISLGSTLFDPRMLARFLGNSPCLQELVCEASLHQGRKRSISKLPVVPSVQVLKLQSFYANRYSIVSEMFPCVTTLDMSQCFNESSFRLIAAYADQLRYLKTRFDLAYFKQFAELAGGMTRMERIDIKCCWYMDSAFANDRPVTCFRQMNRMREANLAFPVNRQTFNIMTSSWGMLERLSLKVERLDLATFSKITSFCYLKYLVLYGNHDEDGFLLEIVTLPSLEHLELGAKFAVLNIHRVSAFAPNLRILKLDCKYLSNDILNFIMQTMMTLEKIYLVECPKIDWGGFLNLDKLTQLVELHCWAMPQMHAIERIPRCSSVKVLSVLPYHAPIHEIPKVFPNLTKLHCGYTTEGELRRFNRMLPNCVVHGNAVWPDWVTVGS